MNFMDEMKKENLEVNNISITENGAVGYKTTGKALVDLNFKTSSLRQATPIQIYNDFEIAYMENPVLAMKWLFFARDVREGMGERRLFRSVWENVCKQPEAIKKKFAKVIPLIPEYGRWDDMWCLLKDEYFRPIVIDIVTKQLEEDAKNIIESNPISLLAKWMPSINASSKQTKAYGKIMCKELKLTEKQYRIALSKMRSYLDIVEKKMSNNEWGEIKYESVPSRANLVYNDAFLRNDEERRRNYLEALTKGETKINSSTLFPCDIVNKYNNARWEDATLESLWKALPDNVEGCGNTMVVADGSGSMIVRINGNMFALDVATSLAIYFSERSKGQFYNKYITFSMNPRFVDFNDIKEQSLYNKIRYARRFAECENTNIEKVFDLVLDTAIRTSAKQEDIPANILIISDMEFDTCACDNSCKSWYCSSLSPNLFKIIEKKYKDAGYKLPRLVFWNVASRTNTIPLRENDNGVALVSGFSTNVCKMVMSGKLNPYECLLETLNSERYKPVEDALK